MEDYRSQLDKAVQYKRQAVVTQKERFKEESRKRLAKTIETKMRTCFIGALAKVEKYIGEQLWGHGKTKLSENEKKWFDVWQECRNEILTNGNNQLRALQNELLQYSVEWLRYNYNLKLKDNGEQNDSSSERVN